MVLRSTAAAGRLVHRALPRATTSSRRASRTSAASTTTLPTIHRRGDHPYGSREYLLCRPAPPELVLLRRTEDRRDSSPNPNNSNSNTETKTRARPTTVEGADGQILQVLATLKANKNILFGASARPVHHSDSSDDDGSRHIPNLCRPLVTAALDDCQEWGEQPQALAALYGLCDYVRQCLLLVQHPVLTPLNEPDRAAIAVLATTGQLPPGHHDPTTATSILDADPDESNDAVIVAAWDALAREFANSTTTAYDCELYRALHFELVGTEWRADTQPAYLQSAGGAMARYFYMAERDESVPYRWKAKK